MHLADIKTTQREVRFDQSRLTIEDVADIAKGKAKAILSDDPQFRAAIARGADCLLYTSPSPRDVEESRMPSSA